jgi:formate-dependent nitrite reductase membrane component NrfD
MTWEWPIAIDLLAAGLAGGAYFSGFLTDRISGGKHALLPKIAMFLGVPLVLLGSLLLVLDLGEQLRAWHLFTRFRPGSAMSMGSWILILYALIGIVMIALWWADSFDPEKIKLTGLSGLAKVIRPARPALGVLSWIALVLAVVLMTYTGVLLSATNQALWASTFLLPVLFVVSAVFTGSALLLLVLKSGLGRLLDILFGGEGETIPDETINAMAKATAVVGVWNVVVLAAFLAWLAFGSTAAAADSVGILTFGGLAFLFWVGVVIVGLLIPLALLYASVRGKEPVVGAILTSACLVLIGGFVLRLVIVLGGQMV